MSFAVISSGNYIDLMQHGSGEDEEQAGEHRGKKGEENGRGKSDGKS